MNGTTKKVYVVYVIFCVLQNYVSAKKKCKSGVSFAEDRKGSLEEVKGSFEDDDQTCAGDYTCFSIRVDEIEVDGNIKKDVVLMRCSNNNLELCNTAFDGGPELVNTRMTQFMEVVYPSAVTKAGTKGAEASCCSDELCNTDLLEKVYTKENPEGEEVEEEAGTSTGSKTIAKLAFTFCFAAFFLLAQFDQ